MAEILFERAFHLDEEGVLKSYWPTYWTVELLLEELKQSNPAFFAASYMNDPSALEGNSLKVHWLHAYEHTELELKRAEAEIERGSKICGIDTAIGGKGADLDFFAMFSMEVINNEGFAIDYYLNRLPLQEQADVVEAWLDTQQPDLVLLEETSAEGYVTTDLKTRVNGGAGTKWPIDTRQPQGGRSQGPKRIRLQGMGARFQTKQIRLPGEVSNEGESIDPYWLPFVNQWRLFPGGHDDLLDACYWAQVDAFSGDFGAGSSYDPRENKVDDDGKLTEEDFEADVYGNVLGLREMSLMSRHVIRQERMSRMRGRSWGDERSIVG